MHTKQYTYQYVVRAWCWKWFGLGVDGNEIGLGVDCLDETEGRVRSLVGLRVLGEGNQVCNWFLGDAEHLHVLMNMSGCFLGYWLLNGHTISGTMRLEYEAKVQTPVSIIVN